MAKRPTYEDMTDLKTPTQRRTAAQKAIIQQDMLKIDSFLATGLKDDLVALHMELDGTYGNVIKNWGASLYAFADKFGFNYEYLGEDSLRENLMMMKGKLRGYMIQLFPESESVQSYILAPNTQNPTTRLNMQDIISGKKLNIAQEYERIWKLFNVNRYAKDNGYATSLAKYIDSSISFFPQQFRARAIDLDDFNATYGFSFPLPNEHITEDELISYCEYVITLCDHLCKYGDAFLEDDSEFQKEDLYSTVESCMDDLGFVAAKRDDITIYVAKNPAVVAAAELVDESLAYDIKDYTHDRTKGNLHKKKTILKFLADEIEPKRKILKANNLGALEDLLFQMLQKFVRHNNDDNTFIRNLRDDELERYYDDIYHLWLTATLEIDSIERKKRAKEVLGEINTPTESTGR